MPSRGWPQNAVNQSNNALPTLIRFPTKRSAIHSTDAVMVESGRGPQRHLVFLEECTFPRKTRTLVCRPLEQHNQHRDRHWRRGDDAETYWQPGWRIGDANQLSSEVFVGAVQCVARIIAAVSRRRQRAGNRRARCNVRRPRSRKDAYPAHPHARRLNKYYRLARTCITACFQAPKLAFNNF